jgi:hypothetical protein
MDIHHATTPRYSKIRATDMRRCGESQTAQIAKAAKAIANAKRRPAHGRFE